jgi:hypothetical protein
MHKITFVIPFILTALVIGACSIHVNVDIGQGSGKIVTETRDVSHFDSLELSGIGDITLIQSDQEALEIEAEDNVLQHITTEVRNGTLYIGLEPKVILPTKPVKYTLKMHNIHGLATRGVSSVKSSGSIHTDRLEIDISGTGSIELEDLTCANLSISISGAGSFQASGKASDQKITLSGAGNYRGQDLQSQTAEVTISGLGQVTLWVTDRLDVTISGTGGVDYYGTPEINQQVSGLVKVTTRK